ncbi:MAG: outer membrane beta-barrel protein [Pseudomonadota bacterium]
MRIALPVVFALALPGVAAAQSYEGFSVGGQLSYGDAETSGAAEVDGDDVLYGLRAYYDADLGSVLVGGGLQYDFTDIDLDGAASADSVLRVAGRVGTVVSDWYVYGTAGYVELYMDEGTVDTGDSDGYFIGIGYEDYLTDTLTVGAELLYHDFSGFDDIDTLDAEVTTLGVSLNYRF